MQRAAQTLLFGILMVPMIGVQGIILLAINTGPGSRAVLGPVLEALVSTGFVLIAGAVLTAIDEWLLAAAVLRFRRHRLILD